MDNTPSKIKTFAALLGGLGFMCTSAILVKSSHAPGIVTVFYRMFIGAVTLLIPFLIMFKSHKAQFTKKGILLAIIAGICFGSDMALWSTGVVASNATIPTVVANIAPIWVGIGSVLLFKEKHSKGFWIGLLLAVAGIPFMVHENLYLENGVLKGALLGLGAGVFYGLYYLIAQEGRKLLDTICFLTISSMSSAIVLAIMVLFSGHSFIGYDVMTYKVFIAIGLGVQVIGWYLISYAQGYIPASIVAPTLLGQPVLTAVLASIILHERLSALQLFGGVIIISGIYIVHFSRQKNKI